MRTAAVAAMNVGNVSPLTELVCVHGSGETAPSSDGADAGMNLAHDDIGINEELREIDSHGCGVSCMSPDASRWPLWSALVALAFVVRRRRVRAERR